jgi:hypothetical protein
MPLFVLQWDDDPNFPTPEPLQSAHRAYFEAREASVLFGVAQTNEAGQSVGRTVVMDLPAKKDAEDFLHNEPFFKAGKTKTSRISIGRIVQQRKS